MKYLPALTPNLLRMCLNREGRPEHRTRNGTGTERERNGTRTREMPVQHLGDSRLPSAFLAAGKTQMAIHNSYLLHLVIPSAFRAARKMQVDSFAFSPFRQENRLASFSNIFAFCYCHKMQLGTLDFGTRSFAFLAAGKKQMAIHNGYLLHLVIPSAFSAARKMQVVSFAFSPFRQENQLVSFSNISAFC